MKKVLILGAGLVVKPMVTYLLENGYEVTVASRRTVVSEQMIDGHPNGRAVAWDASDMNGLRPIAMEQDLVVSLLPYIYHVQVAKLCIELGKNMVTTSYVKPEMMELDDECKQKEIIILNECGLDPGIDHMSAMRVIDHVKANNGTIEEFYSFCGALPAPEYADNPFGYKFSWSPRGVVMAGNNSAKYYRHGKVVDIPTENLFAKPGKVNFEGKIGTLDLYPNRDSISYIDIYGIKGTKTMMRGTFRFKGWCENIHNMKKLGVTLEKEYDSTNKTYKDFIADLIGAGCSCGIEEKTAKFLGLEKDSTVMKSLKWLGYFEDNQINLGKTTALDITTELMKSKMMLSKNEIDLCIMQHTFVADYNGKKEVIKSTLEDYGIKNGDTSIARTVALPAAIAVKMILEGKITEKGVFRPTIPTIYNPILDELETLNIKMVETHGLSIDEIGIELD